MQKTIFLFSILSIFMTSCQDEDNLPTIYDMNPFLTKPGTAAMIIAHRGGAGLEPENTLIAFQNARQMGADAIEVDVSLTSDSILVACHDMTIDRTSDGVGNVNDYTFEELQAFNFAANFEALDGSFPYENDPIRIPSLEEIFIAIPDTKIVVEIKSSGELDNLTAEKVDALIKQYNRHENTVVFSFSGAVMDHFHDINDSEIFTGGSFTDGLEFVQAIDAGTDSSFHVRADMFAFPTELLGNNLSSANIIMAAHDKGVGLHYWTINDKEDMKELINRGADGIITDRPDLLIEALGELGF